MDFHLKKTFSIILCLLFLNLPSICCKYPSRLSTRQFDLRTAKTIVTNAFIDITSKQSICFTHNESIVESHALIKSLSNQTSNYIIDIQTFQQGKKQKSFNLTLFAYPRHSTMYFILKKGNGGKLFDEVKDILRNFDQLSPVVTRPRCALVIYGRILGLSKQNLDKALEDLLQNAWDMKFLDFTIIHILSSKNPVIYYLNPFENLIVNFSLTVHSNSTLFPNKLINVKNYTIHIPIPHVYNGTCVFRDKNGDLEHFLMTKADTFIFVKQFFDYTKIRVVWDVQNMSFMVFMVVYPVWLSRLSKNTITMLPMSFQRFGNHSLIKQVETSRYFDFADQQIFVPNIKTSKFSFPFELLETSLLFGSIIFSFYIISRAFKLSKKEWSVKKITFMLVGVPVDDNSTKFLERVFIVFLSMLSLTVTSELIGSFLGFLREEKLVVYETLNDINETDMQILIFDHTQWFNDNDTVVNDIMAKTIPVVMSSDHLSIYQNPFIFIGPRLYASVLNNLMQKFFSAYPNYIMPSNISLYTVGRSLPFEKNSPYLDVFNMVFLRTTEFGLDIAAQMRYDHRCKEDSWFTFEWETPHKSEDISGICIFIMFCAGAFFSCLIFLWEACTNKNVGRNDRRRRWYTMSYHRINRVRRSREI